MVLPNPTDPVVIRAFERGAFKEFERHSRVGMVTEVGFAKRVEELRKAGAKHIFLKTGAYRPADLARAVAFSSKYQIDLLTVDAAGGGTGMSPWHMMNEWGVPPVELHSLLYQYLKRIDERGDYVPPVAVGGGFTFEDQIFKGLALGAPYVKMIGMARAPLAAAMVRKTIGRAIEENQLPVYVERFGNTVDRRVLHLIKMWLECAVEETDQRGRKIRTTEAKDSGRGIPQGSPISPLLSNLYMRRFVLAWKKLGLERSLGSRSSPMPMIL